MTLNDRPVRSDNRLLTVVEFALIVLFFYVIGGISPPDVNESHYLAKAKYYWDPQWCSGDLFLQSADAHWTFYWSFGWLTRFWSLDAVAWIGRFLTWGLLAWRWQRLSNLIFHGPLRALLSAAVFVSLCRWGHMAGEWVVGGVEAKGFAYVLVLVALEAIVRGQLQRALIACGAASAFHVLVGGWAMLAVGVAWLSSDSSRRPPLIRFIPAGLMALVLAMPGILPGLALNWSADPEIIREANRIYVFERLAHHLTFNRLPPIFIARHFALVVLFLVLQKTFSKRIDSPVFSGPLPRFVMAAILFAVLGAVIDQCLLSERPLAAVVLRYYWFRLSDVMTPLGVTFTLLAIQQRFARAYWKTSIAILIALVAMVAADIGYVLRERQLDPRPGAFIQACPAHDRTTEDCMQQWRQWLNTCKWIRANTDSNEVFLTPRNQQTFKWDAERAEVVNGKDIPQDAAGIVAWRRRMDEIFPHQIRYADLAGHGETRLIELSRKYGFRYIVIDRGVSKRKLDLPRVYPDTHDSSSLYEVYRVPVLR